jgi:diguanylate cyclase (GGDEF)-like protein
MAAVGTPRRWPRPIDDAARVAALHQLGVLDRPADADLEAIARVASYVCGTSAAAVNLIDEERQWQAAAYGVRRGEVSRDDSMCGWAILSDGVTYTPDASQDGVFADHPFVTGRLGSVRLYVSAPVTIDPGHVVGTLCAFGEEPGQLSEVQIRRLSDLADAAARILELRRTLGTFARAATTDPLTGLPNRAVFLETVRQGLDLHARGVSWPGVLYLDLDRFKPVNDEHGHHAGDTVLRAVAARLLQQLRGTEVATRLGGDEFAVLVEDTDRDRLESRLREVGDRLGEALAGPIRLPRGEVVVGASIGSAIAAGDTSPEALMTRADLAMYAHKARTGLSSRRIVDEG